MKTNLLILLCALSALMLTSCRQTAERVAQKIRFEGVESVHMESLSTVVIDFAIENGTAHRLRAEQAVAKLRYRGSEVGSMRLIEPVEVDRRSHAVVPTRWRIELRNPLAMLSVAARVAQQEYDELTVDLSVAGSGGPVPVNISREKVPMSNFLNTFGIEPDFLTSILQQR